MVSAPGRDMCESMTEVDSDDPIEPKATPWPKAERPKNLVVWPPEQDESTWGERKCGDVGEE